MFKNYSSKVLTYFMDIFLIFIFYCIFNIFFSYIIIFILNNLNFFYYIFKLIKALFCLIFIGNIINCKSYFDDENYRPEEASNLCLFLNKKKEGIDFMESYSLCMSLYEDNEDDDEEMENDKILFRYASISIKEAILYYLNENNNLNESGRIRQIIVEMFKTSNFFSNFQYLFPIGFKFFIGFVFHVFSRFTFKCLHPYILNSGYVPLMDIGSVIQDVFLYLFCDERVYLNILIWCIISVIGDLDLLFYCFGKNVDIVRDYKDEIKKYIESIIEKYKEKNG